MVTMSRTRTHSIGDAVRQIDELQNELQDYAGKRISTSDILTGYNNPSPTESEEEYNNELAPVQREKDVIPRKFENDYGDDDDYSGVTDTEESLANINNHDTVHQEQNDQTEDANSSDEYWVADTDDEAENNVQKEHQEEGLHIEEGHQRQQQEQLEDQQHHEVDHEPEDEHELEVENEHGYENEPEDENEHENENENENENEHEDQEADSDDLVLPDINVSRISSIGSRVTNGTNIFKDPKPTEFETVYEEDNDYASKNFNKQGSLDDNHEQFISNAGYSESVMSYDDQYSFMPNDDREDRDYDDQNSIDNYNDTDNDTDNDANNERVDNINDRLTISDRTSVGTSTGSLSTGKLSRSGTITDANTSVLSDELKHGIEEMRNDFMRSNTRDTVKTGFSGGISMVNNDIHGKNSVPPKMDDILEDVDNFGESESLSHHSSEDSKIEGDSNLDYDDDAGTFESDKTLETVEPEPIDDKVIKENDRKILKFSEIPKINLASVLSQGKPEAKLEQLKSYRSQLYEVDIGINWYLENMMKNNSGGVSNNDSRIGPNVKNAYVEASQTNHHIAMNPLTHGSVANAVANVDIANDIIRTSSVIKAKSKNFLKKIHLKGSNYLDRV